VQNGIPQHIANYNVERRLGRGAMGTVYLARDRELGRHVAIKLIQADVDSSDMRERFNREARSIAALNHPNIVTLYHAGQEESVPYLVLEYIDGRSILHVISKREPVPLPHRLLWIEQLCEGLQYAHERGIIHRDIKPANLMIDHLDRLRILDFGIARIFGEAKTAMSTLIGTPAYMAPEYIRGEGIDARADVFAVGAVAYELLSYQRAFSGDTQSTILHRVLSEMPPRFVEAGATDLDPELEQIVFRALSKDQNARFQTAREFAEAIRTARARIEMSAQAWVTSGAGVATVTIDRQSTTEPAWSGVGGGPGERTAVPDQAAFAPTQFVDSRDTSDLPQDKPSVARVEQPASDEDTILSSLRRASPVIHDVPQERPSEPRAATPPPSNKWRYAAIGACVLIIPAALFTWLAYVDKPEPDTAGGSPTTVVQPPPPIDPAIDRPTDPPVDRTPPVVPSATNNMAKVTNGGTAKNDATAQTDGSRNDAANLNKPGGGGVIVPIKPESNDVGPVRTAYELFTASTGPTMPGLLYRILQRTNGSDSVVSVDPRDTVFRTGRDEFRFAFRSNIDGYLYVAQKNERGDWDVVFPDPDVNGGSNRVHKNQDYLAPSPHWFQLAPPSGTERVFVFLSKAPVSAFTDLNRPVTSQATLTLAQAEIDKLQSTISMRKLVVSKGDVPAAAAVTGGSGVYVVNADAFADAVMVTFEMTHK
jgi:serine/threonine protein kinase